MPGMSEQVAKDAVSLSTDDRFKRLWDYFKAIEAELQEQINNTLTPKDEREIWVFVRQRLQKDVISVVQTAENILRKKEQLTGQAARNP